MHLSLSLGTTKVLLEYLTYLPGYLPTRVPTCPSKRLLVIAGLVNAALPAVLFQYFPLRPRDLPGLYI